MIKLVSTQLLPRGKPRLYNVAMKVGELIKEYRDRHGWSGAQLARKAGISAPAVWRLEHGERLGRGDTIARLVKALQIDPTLMQAAMEEEGYQVPLIAPEPEPTVEDLLRQAQVQYEKIRPVRIPLVDQRVTAGYIGGASADVEYLEYVPREGERKHDLLAIRVSGDCLEPRVMDGHTVIVDRDVEAKENDIVLALYEGEALLKEYRLVDGRPHLVALQGQKPIPMNIETRIIGVVVKAEYRP